MGILICGLNGAGKSTIGRMLAERMNYRFIDNEDLYFPKNEETYLYSHPRNKDEVIRLLEKMIEKDNKFIFAAVKGDYGERLIASLDVIALIDVPRTVRSSRVRERSFLRFGKRILEGGDLYERESAWFSLVNSKPEDYVTEWLKTVTCPVIRIDGTLPVEQNVEFLINAVTKGSQKW